MRQLLNKIKTYCHLKQFVNNNSNFLFVNSLSGIYIDVIRVIYVPIQLLVSV